MKFGALEISASFEFGPEDLVFGDPRRSCQNIKTKPLTALQDCVGYS